MLSYRAWEIRTSRVSIPETSTQSMPDLSFNHVENKFLHILKHIVQSLVVSIAKYWFIASTKVKKWVSEKWPKVYSRFTKKSEVVPEVNKKPSFFEKALLESRAKIKRIKEKVKKEHEVESDSIK